MKLLHGNCLELLATLEPGSIDMILTDPPYGTTKCKWDSVVPLQPMWWLLKRVIKPRGAIVLMAGQPFTTFLISSNLKMFKYCWVWKKPQGVDPFMSNIRPLNNTEDVVIFCDGRTAYNPQLVAGKPYRVNRDGKPRVFESIGDVIMRPTSTVNTDTGLPTRVLEFKQERGLHPTQKPTALMEYLIKTYTDPGGMVLDFTMGSGTTGVAAVRTGREFTGIELDEKYFNMAKDRINLGVLNGKP